MSYSRYRRMNDLSVSNEILYGFWRHNVFLIPFSAWIWAVSVMACALWFVISQCGLWIDIDTMSVNLIYKYVTECPQVFGVHRWWLLFLSTVVGRPSLLIQRRRVTFIKRANQLVVKPLRQSFRPLCLLGRFYSVTFLRIATSQSSLYEMPLSVTPNFLIFCHLCRVVRGRRPHPPIRETLLTFLPFLPQSSPLALKALKALRLLWIFGTAWN